MNQTKTSYHFKITTSEEIIHVFATVMSHADEETLLDLWCPEEPRLNQRITATCASIPQSIETMLYENLNQIMPAGSYSIRYLLY